MVLFASGLAHALHRVFGTYESALARRRATLAKFADERQAVTAAVYEQLEPLSENLSNALSAPGEAAAQRAHARTVLDQLIDQLRRARILAKAEDFGPSEPLDLDGVIRSRTMRVWLRIGAALMAFFVLRNWHAGVPFVPSIFSFFFCLLFDWWLGRSASARHLEATALAIGLFATGPMLAYVHSYAARPDAPPLLVTPGTVLFTALLSQGPAAWAIVFLNVGILVWVGFGKVLTLTQSRLLGDLGLSFLVVVVALRSVFDLRRRYARELVDQAQSMAAALRQHRRLAGTLFHDASNHLQVLSFELDPHVPSADHRLARSLARRVQRLIAQSKEFLLPETGALPPPEPLTLTESAELLREAFGPRLEAKRLRFVAGPGLELCVCVQPVLFVESVLGNLVSNAIKFSPPGSVITLRAEAEGSKVRVEITDEGPGLPSEVLARLGEEGPVPNRPGTKGEAGQGYGLQLAREHLQRMGGSLELGNRDGGGAVARLWLPSG
jgi:signal transduction histidine kinase